MSPTQEIVLAVGIAFFETFLYQGVYLMWPQGRWWGALFITIGVSGLMFLPVALIPQYRVYVLSDLAKISIRGWYAIPVLAIVSLISVGLRAIADARLFRELNSLANATDKFRNDPDGTHIYRGPVAPGGAQWVRYRNDYVQRYGRTAARLLKGTSYGTSLDYVLRPASFHDLKIATVLLRAYGNSLSQDRTWRWLKTLGRDIGLGASVFLVAWFLAVMFQSVPIADPREIPADQIMAFKAALPPFNSDEVVEVECFRQVDPSSCQIAQEYYNLFADHWGVKPMAANCVTANPKHLT